MHGPTGMALREFTDSTGCRWRVWDIRPEQMPAAARAEDHLQNVIHGWLAFEPAGGGEKKRLSPIPARWENASDAELERMLDRADPMFGETPTPPRTAEPVLAASDARPATVQPTIRTFRYPNGRYWTVNEQPLLPATGGQQRPLLVFTSGARALETRNWPSEWPRLSEHELADLLYRSFPRDPLTENRTTYRRRRGDA